MAVIYLLIAVGVVVWNITSLPKVLLTIVENAFGFNQAAGGVLGVTVIQGIKRGLFSNEAGEGSAPNAAAVATVSHPVKQGLIQALGVFTDTLVVCSCTAFIILVSGVDLTASNGIQLTQDALTHEIGNIGNPFVAVMIWLFAFSSIIGNYYYGETNVRYIRDSKLGVFVYRLAVAAMVMVGAVVSLDFAWSFADITMALLTLCNLAAIVLLSRQAVFLLKDYRQQKKEARILYSPRIRCQRLQINWKHGKVTMMDFHFAKIYPSYNSSTKFPDTNPAGILRIHIGDFFMR